MHWPAPMISRVNELPLVATDQARELKGRWVDIPALESVTVQLRGELLRGISDAELDWLKLAARGPFSFRDLAGDQLTYAPLEDCILFATTYQSMMRCGWVN